MLHRRERSSTARQLLALAAVCAARGASAGCSDASVDLLDVPHEIEKRLKRSRIVPRTGVPRSRFIAPFLVIQS